MQSIDDILEIEPYSLGRAEKRELLNRRLCELTRMHYDNCMEYRRMFDATGMDINNLPEAVLKELDSRIDEYRCTCGYFTEYTSASLDELDKIIKTNTKLSLITDLSTVN